MLTLTNLQTTSGGSPIVVVLTLLGLLVTAVLSLIVASLVIRGYRRNRDPARLYLAIGLVLLTTGPIVLQFVLTNLGSPPGIRSAVANASKLVGLAAMLYAIYGASRPGRRPRSKRRGDRNPDAERSEESS
ncbi:DUF7521 family protein [Halosolutus gelatinilyticus]|uniref:DUF7521 family protein n=1 Tax=Halosolutus gelatinilyticus TaxID=2931975 RepID=UPI001FF42423|nr:hypothetical protein [Halosolutus gelatinilyticus]